MDLRGKKLLYLLNPALNSELRKLCVEKSFQLHPVLGMAGMEMWTTRKTGSVTKALVTLSRLIGSLRKFAGWFLRGYLTRLLNSKFEKLIFHADINILIWVAFFLIRSVYIHVHVKRFVKLSGFCRFI